MAKNQDYYFDRINEAIDELTSDYEDFDSFKKGVNDPDNHPFYVYSQVGRDAIPNICVNGAEGAKEFMNTSHMYYGRGIYTTMSFDQLKNYNEGDAVVKYAVRKDAFDNFLIFDMGVRIMLYKAGYLSNNHEKISSTCRRLFSKEDFETLEYHYGKNLQRLDKEVEECKCDRRSWGLEEDFWRIFRGSCDLKLRKDSGNYYNEKKLDESNVDGFAYWAGGSGYGPVAIFRTTDILTPVSYSYRQRGGGWRYGSFPDEKDMQFAIANEHDFENINATIDGFRRGRKDYPNTGFTDKTICGFALVKGPKGCNFLNSRTGQLLSPVNFDFCESFSPISHKAVCTKNYNGETFEFEITSETYGRDISIKFRVITDDDPVWEDVPYSEFCDFMKGTANQQNSVNESVEEVFTHKTHSDFVKTIDNPNNVYLYRAAPPQVSKSEYEKGCNFEYVGTKVTPTTDDSLYYGFGIYTVRDLDSLLGGKYGMGVCKFILKDGYKDFVILDDDLRHKMDPKHKTVYDELVDLVPKDLFDKLNYEFTHHGLPTRLNNSSIQNSLETKGMDAFKDINVSKMYNGVYNTASFARGLKLLLQGHNLHDNLARNAYDELLMAKTKIRGFVYNGGSDGLACLVRDTNSLMPVAYSTDGGRTWKDDNNNEERFNELNQKVHPWYLYKGEYNKMGLRDRASCGFSLVKGSQGCNYKDIWFHRPLLPIDVQDGQSFDVMSKTAQFTLADVPFEVRIQEDHVQLFYEDEGTGGMEPCGYNEFMEFVKEAQNQGMIPKGKFYPNNILKDGYIKR